MFCTFTTMDGRTLIIRTEDLRELSDREGGGCTITWLLGTQVRAMSVQDTAAENLDRLRAEELAALEMARQLQQRQGNGLPILPVARGKIPR